MIPMPLHFPQLRPGLIAAQDDDPRIIYLVDQLQIVRKPFALSEMEFSWVRLFNGRRSLRDIQAEALRRFGGMVVAIDFLTNLVQRLDSALFLDSATFHGYLHGPDRHPSCIGCYPEDATEIHASLSTLFTAQGGPGLPGQPGCRIASEGRVRAVLVPHIDYARGGVTYGWGFKEIFERTDAKLFVIIGTSHYSPERFTLTRKNYRSPLGTVPTDQAFIDRLVSAYGEGLFNDPIAHLPEHSIELEMVLLQYLYQGHSPFRIVPLVVGSFGDCIHAGVQPRQCDDIGRMIAALQKVEATWPEPICYIISGDLAHIGPKFDDPEPVDLPQLEESLRRDQQLMAHAERGDLSGYFKTIQSEGDARRICGLPPTYTTLEAVKARRGRLLHYGRYVHPEGYESVSFASAAFDA